MTETAPVALTVMTYNIKNGGAGGRLDAISRVIADQQPDLLALEELRSFHRHGGRLLRRLSDAVGMRPFLARSRLGGQPVAILVRQPAAVRSAGRIRRPFHHAAAVVSVATDRGPLTVIGTHLYPFSGGRRLREAGWLAARVDSQRMVLVMGDLNTLDPWADHTDRLRTLPPRYRFRHLTRSGDVDTRAVRRLADAGLIDVFRAVGPAPGGQTHTVPTTHGGGHEFARMRLDYILGTPPVARLARSCRVVTDGDSEAASDHYPLVATFDLTVTEPAT